MLQKEEELTDGTKIVLQKVHMFNSMDKDKVQLTYTVSQAASNTCTQEWKANQVSQHTDSSRDCTHWLEARKEKQKTRRW